MVETVVFKCLKSTHQVPNNGILEEVTHGSMIIVAKQSLAVATRFISGWSRNLEVVLVAIFSSTVTAAVLRFISGWSRVRINFTPA
jgi:L-asparagine transporter-like permease